MLMMTRLWVFLIAAAFLIGILSGRMEYVSAAVMDGTKGAVELIIVIVGIMCLWSGLMRVMQKSGLASIIAKLLSPVISIIFNKKISRDKEAMELISANMTANLLGLSNASTPIGLQAAARIHKLTGEGKNPSDELITLIVINTASLQLIPTTVAAVRASFGSLKPYDILPSVWLASLISISAGLVSITILKRIWKN